MDMFKPLDKNSHQLQLNCKPKKWSQNKLNLKPNFLLMKLKMKPNFSQMKLKLKPIKMLRKLFLLPQK